jgi:hypothetical protein
MDTDRSEPSLSSEAVQAALELLLSYLVQQVRQVDGMPAPPLLDRDDFLEYVALAREAKAARWSPEQAQGLDWLDDRLRWFGAGRPG